VGVDAVASYFLPYFAFCDADDAVANAAGPDPHRLQ
jgi:hypothetical protein